MNTSFIQKTSVTAFGEHISSCNWMPWKWSPVQTTIINNNDNNNNINPINMPKCNQMLP